MRLYKGFVRTMHILRLLSLALSVAVICFGVWGISRSPVGGIAIAAIGIILALLSYCITQAAAALVDLLSRIEHNTRPGAVDSTVAGSPPTAEVSSAY